MTDEDLTAFLLDIAHAPSIPGGVLAEASDRLSRYGAALREIAEDVQWRSGYCQTDISVGPKLSADEANSLAKMTVSGF